MTTRVLSPLQVLSIPSRLYRLNLTERQILFCKTNLIIDIQVGDWKLPAPNLVTFFYKSPLPCQKLKLSKVHQLISLPWLYKTFTPDEVFSIEMIWEN